VDGKREKEVTEMRESIVTIIGSGLLSFIVLSCAGCGAGDLRIENYGDMKPNRAVTVSFETYQTNSKLKYYMSGPLTAPTGLMGIEKEYILESELWRGIDDPLHALKGLVRGMRSKAAEYNLTLYGFDIRDNRGNDIGDWYSILDGRMPVKITGEKRVMVYPPPNDIYERVRFRRFDTEDD